ncbi:MAG: FAD-binding protein [Deltaproteobacteria bacterium]|nr:FAD-binding protein [Deltaproteobacteria bacterium]
MLARRVRKALQEIVGEAHARFDPAQLALYAYDATPFAAPAQPDGVLMPASAEEVAGIVRLAGAEGLPVVPRGAGTNLTGGARAVQGGLVLAMTRMDRILAVDADSFQAVVQPGVVTEDLQEAAGEQGLFYPPDPQSADTCTLGGNLAENAGGPRAVKYGVTRQYVLALQVVLASGQIVRLGARTLKSVAGYDLCSLMVGSEGTLGIITEATLRLLPAPERRETLLAVFERLRDAAKAVCASMRSGVIPSAVELVDEASLRCLPDLGLDLPEAAAAVLVMEVDGSAAEAVRAAGRLAEVMQAGGACRVMRAADEAEAERLWKARREVGPSLARIAPLRINEDIVVPIARLPEAISGIHELAREQDVTCACFGHAGDGNIHVNFLLQPDRSGERERVERAVARVFDLVVGLGGSITGEHGVGTTKQAFLGLELGAEVVELMRRVKAALDPDGILNPGKVLPLPGLGRA